MDTVREPGADAQPFRLAAGHDWRADIQPADLAGDRWAVVAVDPVREDNAADVVLFGVRIDPTTTMGRTGIGASHKDEEGRHVMLGNIAPPRAAAAVLGGLEVVGDVRFHIHGADGVTGAFGERLVHLRRLSEGVTELECPCCSDNANVELRRADGVHDVMKCPACRGSRALTADHDNRWQSEDE